MEKDILVPILYDVSMRLLLVHKLINNFKIKTWHRYNICRGRSGNNVFIELPKGVREVDRVDENDIRELKKEVYGFAEPVRRFMKNSWLH